MGSKSSKFVKKYEYHAHLQQIQNLIDQLQQQQASFSVISRQQAECFEEFMSDVKEGRRKQENALELAEQQISMLKEKLSSINELDSMKANLHQVKIEHNEDRVQLSSHLKEAISKEKNKWETDILELKERFEGIRQHSMELVSMDLQHEREINDLQKRIHKLENKLYNHHNHTRLPSSSELLMTTDSSKKTRKLSETPTFKDSAFFSLKPSLVRESESCNLCDKSKSTDEINNLQTNSSSYHLKFSKINMAMQKLKDDIRYAELKKTASITK